MKIWKLVLNSVKKEKSHMILSKRNIFSWNTAQKLVWPTEWKVHQEVSIPLIREGFHESFFVSPGQHSKCTCLYYIKARKTVISAISICHPLHPTAFTLRLPFPRGNHFVICYVCVIIAPSFEVDCLVSMTPTERQRPFHLCEIPKILLCESIFSV